jgi:hypothetical protein
LLPGFSAARRYSGIRVVISSLTAGEFFMVKTNVGGSERMVRIVVGAALILLVFVGPKTQWGWLGLIPLATGFLSTCPLYTLLGKSSVPSDPTE